MPDWLLDRSTIIGLAVIGGLCSVLASWFGSRNLISEQQIGYLNKVAYVFMGTSMVLFVTAGLLGAGNPG